MIALMIARTACGAAADQAATIDPSARHAGARRCHANHLYAVHIVNQSFRPSRLANSGCEHMNEQGGG